MWDTNDLTQTILNQHNTAYIIFVQLRDAMWINEGVGMQSMPPSPITAQ